MKNQPKDILSSKEVTQKQLLVVDDLKVNFLLIKALLQKIGFDTVWAEDGYKAIDLIKAGNPFIAVLMDYNMPGIDGLQTTYAIKKIRPDIKVISHSTFTDNPLFDKSTAPYDDYLPKPIKSESLRMLIHKHC
ncbi:MAG: response regulator [Bacteroidetes bacterium]|jgi:CheY-like chemotaxis protein|nr:response regulator [Bacteroidota bacterium]